MLNQRAEMDISADTVAQEAIRRWRDDVEVSNRLIARSIRALAPELTPTSPELSTMTVVISTDASFDLPAIHAIFDAHGSAEPQNTDHELTRKITLRGFKNHVCIQYTCPPSGGSVHRMRRSLSIYAKGTVHIAGCRSVADGLECAQRVVNHVISHSPAAPKAIAVTNVDIALLNFDFKMNTCLYPKELAAVAVYDYKVRATYNPEIHPASIVSFKGVSAMAFTTGAVLLSGAKTMRAMGEAYAFITGLIHEKIDRLVCKEAVVVTRRGPRKDKRSFVEFAASCEAAIADRSSMKMCTNDLRKAGPV